MTDWTVWKADDIFICTKDSLSVPRWRLLCEYVQKVLKPLEPHWSEWGSPFGFVGVGDDPMKVHESSDRS